MTPKTQSFVVYVPANAFRLTRGSLLYYTTPSVARGHNQRGFCAECGSHITGAESDRGIGITASSLDDPSWFRPKMNIRISDAQPWDILDPAPPKFDQYPPAR